MKRDSLNFLLRVRVVVYLFSPIVNLLNKVLRACVCVCTCINCVITCTCMCVCARVWLLCVCVCECVWFDFPLSTCTLSVVFLKVELLWEMRVITIIWTPVQLLVCAIIKC